MSDNSPTSPRPPRRPRYRGKNPRRFEEKYKERDPQRYAETVEKVLASGKTPAGTSSPGHGGGDFGNPCSAARPDCG